MNGALHRPITDFSKARILVTNDDGIHAPGLVVLEAIARSLSPDVTVVAPELEQSGAGHSLTLRRPLRLRSIDAHHHAVDGTPTDCVIVGVHKVMAGRPPDLVLSGVNRSANLCEDVTYSGTVSAALEAALMDLPAIALSQVLLPGDQVDFGPAERFGAAVIRRLAAASWPKDILYNVNFPGCSADAVTGMAATRQGRRVGSVNLIDGADAKGRPILWIGDFEEEQRAEPGTDLAAVLARQISVTPLHFDFTHGASIAPLAAALAEAR